MALKKVVLVGASGTLGSQVLKTLSSDPDFQVTVLARPESKATFPESLRVLRVEQTHDNLVDAFCGQDAVVCTTGVRAILDQKQLIDAAIAADVQRFILNEFANPLSFGGLPDLQYAREPKTEVLKYAQEQAARHHNFSWTGIATGHFLDYAIFKFPGFGFDLVKQQARLVDDGSERFSATTVPDIAVAIAGVLKSPQATANQYLNIRSTETTQLELLHAFEAETKAKWATTHVTSNELLTNGREKVAKGQPSAMIDLVVAQLFEKGAGRNDGHWDTNANELLVVKQKTATAIVREVLDEQARRVSTEQL